MRKYKIALTLWFIVITASLLSACDQQTTTTFSSQEQPTATASITLSQTTEAENSSTTTNPSTSTAVVTFDRVVSPTPTTAVTTIAIGNITAVPYTTTPPTLNITPIVLPTFTATAQDSIAPGNAAIGEPDTEERNFLELLNAFRKTKNSQPLTFDPHLFQSARWMAQDMATKSYINHTDSLGRNVATRIQAFGFGSKWVGENIAGGLEHANDNLSIWQSDDIHLNNMANPYWTKAGVGRYYFKTGFNRWVWVLDMG